MKTTERKVSLEDILNEYLASETEPSYEALERWAKRFPEYKTELAEFTANWSKVENTPENDTETTVDKETLVLRAMSIVGDRIHTARTNKQDNKARLTNLVAEAKKKGLGIKDLARFSQLSVPIVSKIDRGFLDPLTIPKIAIERFASAIDRTADELLFFMENSTMSAQGIHYKSKKQPELPIQKESFFDAVRNDTELSEDQRKTWLEMEHKQ